jgi:hypothetical protein
MHCCYPGICTHRNRIKREAMHLYQVQYYDMSKDMSEAMGSSLSRHRYLPIALEWRMSRFVLPESGRCMIGVYI